MIEDLEISTHNSFWKWSDDIEAFTTLKLKSLSISPKLINAEPTHSTARELMASIRQFRKDWP